MNYLTRDQGIEQYYKLEEQAILVAVSSGGLSIATIFEMSSRHKILNFVQKVNLELSDVKTFKLLGPKKIVSGAYTILNNAVETEIKKVEREGTFEIFFFPDEGRVRVTKQEEKHENFTINKKLKVMIVDDSKTIRNLLNRVFSSTSDIDVVAMAEKPSDVEALIAEHKPDVLTLDIHMPEMTGVELLKIIAPKYNIPTIMVTSISMEEGPLVLEALENGAFDYIQKPDISQLSEVSEALIARVREAGASKKSAASITKLGTRPVNSLNQDALVVIGSSTGGTNALKDILTKLPADIPPMLIVQHIPPVFSKAFADRMNSLCPFEVKEASDGDIVQKNTVYVAPGGLQMKPVNKGGTVVLEINDDPPVNRFKPSVDYLFKHTLPLIKRRQVVSVILTGMGKDGAREMLNLKNAGALTIAQNEESCVVYGMPKEAIEIGSAIAIEHKDDIASKISEFTWPDDLKQKA